MFPGFASVDFHFLLVVQPSREGACFPVPKRRSYPSTLGSFYSTFLGSLYCRSSLFKRGRQLAMCLGWILGAVERECESPWKIATLMISPQKIQSRVRAKDSSQSKLHSNPTNRRRSAHIFCFGAKSHIFCHYIRCKVCHRIFPHSSTSHTNAITHFITRRYRYRLFDEMRPQGTLALALIGLAVLPKTTSAAEFRSLAIARTFSVSDADLLPRSFEIWNDFPPCQEGIVERVDLYLIYAQSLDESPSAQASIEEVQEIFSKTSGWGGCISNVYGLGVNIDPSVDLYRLEEQSSNPLWVNGPNRQFERTIRALQGVTVGSCDLLYLMEIDSVPIQDFWLDTIVQEVHQDSKEFAILGR